jgi:hypothetical protein
MYWCRCLRLTCHEQFTDRSTKSAYQRAHASGRDTNYDCRRFDQTRRWWLFPRTTWNHPQQREQQRHHQLYSSPKDEIVSFMDTDLDAVVAHPQRSRAIPIGATKRNTSPRTLQSNSFRRYRQESQCPRYPRKGTNMRVIQDGEKMQMCKTQGINRILYNNHRIATDDKTAVLRTSAYQA